VASALSPHRCAPVRGSRVLAVVELAVHAFFHGARSRVLFVGVPIAWSIQRCHPARRINRAIAKPARHRPDGSCG
jgi:hypothetical protein